MGQNENSNNTLSAEEAALLFFKANPELKEEIMGGGLSKYSDYSKEELESIDPKEKERLGLLVDYERFSKFVESIKIIGASNFFELDSRKQKQIFYDVPTNKHFNNRSNNTLRRTSDNNGRLSKIYTLEKILFRANSDHTVTQYACDLLGKNIEYFTDSSRSNIWWADNLLENAIVKKYSGNTLSLDECVSLFLIDLNEKLPDNKKITSLSENQFVYEPHHTRFSGSALQALENRANKGLDSRNF